MNSGNPCHQFRSRVGRALRRVCLCSGGLLLACLGWTQAAPADEVHLFRSLQADRNRVYQGPPGSGGGHPLVCRLGNGEVLAVFQAWEADSDWRILSARSRDGGLHWSEPRVLVDGPDSEGNLALGVLQDGTVLLEIMLGYHSWGGGGYPCTIRLDSGLLLTLYYGNSHQGGQSFPFVEAVRWNLP